PSQPDDQQLPFWLRPENRVNDLQALIARGYQQPALSSQISNALGGNPFASGAVYDQGLQFDPGSAQIAPPAWTYRGGPGGDSGQQPNNPNPAPPNFSAYGGDFGGRDFGGREQI